MIGGLMKKISLSAFRKYHACPQMYNQHYNERMRPIKVSSSLPFGKAFDEACNHMLLGKPGCPIEVFREHFKFEDLQHVEWGKYDWDPRLIEPDLLEEVVNKGWAYQCWAALRVKGRLLVEEYQRVIIPKIDKVISVQSELDERPGFIDFIAVINGEKVLVDNKTASRPYRDDSVQDDLQLALYTYSKGLSRAGFAVAVKNIQFDTIKTCKKCGFINKGTSHRTCPAIVNEKRCGGEWSIVNKPIPQVQLIIDDVLEDLQETLNEQIGKTEECIAAGQFPRILNHCKNYYGESCPYYRRCWLKSDEGLQKVPERDTINEKEVK